MNMGVATVPNLSELEAEIERRGGMARLEYADELIKAAGGSGPMPARVVIGLTRLTETQKAQAALKVLNDSTNPT